MKNLILTLFLVMPLFITAQNGIAFNQTENGYRMVAAKSVAVKNGKKDNMPIKYALSVIAKDGDVEWSLLLSIQDVNPFVISQGDIMKVFLPDEKVYDLHQSLPDHDTVDNTGVYNKKAALRIYTMIASYNLSEDELKNILKEGVSSIQINTNRDRIKINYDEKAFKQLKSTLNTQYKILDKALDE